MLELLYTGIVTILQKYLTNLKGHGVDAILGEQALV